MSRTIRARKKLSQRRGPALNASERSVASRSGSLLIDALLAIVIFGAVVGAFSTGVIEGQQGTIRGGNRVRAVFLAEEGLEAVRSIRDKTNGYATQIANKDPTKIYGAQLVGSNWLIIEGTTTIDGFFTRAIAFTNPNNQSNERAVTSSVTWNEPNGQSRSVSLSTYLSNWREDPSPPPPDWSQPQHRGAGTDASLDQYKFHDVATRGNYAYVAVSTGVSGGGLVIFDITNVTTPGNPPTYDNFLSVPPDALDIAISGNYAYLATTDPAGEIRVLDISVNPPVCCAGTIDMPGTNQAFSVSISGTGLYVVKDIVSPAVGEPELFVYDIGISATAPPLDYQVESDGRSFLAVTTTGSLANQRTPYVYLATNDGAQELTVVSVTGSAITGGAGAGSTPRANAVAVFNTGAFVGVEGGDLCEIFGNHIEYAVDTPLASMHNPNQDHGCTTAWAFDVGDEAGKVNDLAVSNELGLLFIATDTQRGATNAFMQVLDVNDVRNIDSLSKLIFNGLDPMTLFNIQNGNYYRESDHTLFTVGGDAGSTSHLSVYQPRFGY